MAARYAEGGFEEAKHPRDKDGKFMDKGDIEAARGDPAKAETLRQQVRPEDASKLEVQIKGKPAAKKKSSQGDTDAVKDYSTDRFQSINAGLRDGKLQPHDAKIVAGVDRYLNAQAKREGATLRSFQADPAMFHQVEQSLESGTFSDPAFISTRKTPTLTDRAAFQQKLTAPGQIVLKITGKNGVDISEHSLNPAEGEVLYPRGTRFKVEKYVKTEGGGLLAELTEIEPAKKFAEPADFALPGSDGAKAVDLLGSVQSAGCATLANLCQRAAARLYADPSPAEATTLFTDEELQELADSISSALSAGDLLGRARVHGLAAKAGVQEFAEINPFEAFADPIPSLLPRAAIDYFRSLVPSLGINADRYGPLMERHAFTMAHAADQVILGKVKDALAAFLRGEPETIPGTAEVPGFGAERGGEVVGRLLREAGVSPANPQYAEMVYRTNLMDSYQSGVHAELATPEMQAMFPVWQYLGILDGREGDDHRPKFNRYYPSSASFAEVRGDRPFNCRCSSRPVTKFEWARLQQRGAQAESSW